MRSERSCQPALFIWFVFYFKPYHCPFFRLRLHSDWFQFDCGENPCLGLAHCRLVLSKLGGSQAADVQNEHHVESNEHKDILERDVYFQPRVRRLVDGVAVAVPCVPNGHDPGDDESDLVEHAADCEENRASVLDGEQLLVELVELGGILVKQGGVVDERLARNSGE